MSSEASHSSSARSSESDAPSGPAANPPMNPAQNGLKLTTEDVTILKGYIREFEEADTQMRNRILEKAMGGLYKLRPGNSLFDKKEAKQVCR
jgi:hypothetical protein